MIKENIQEALKLKKASKKLKPSQQKIKLNKYL